MVDLNILKKIKKIKVGKSPAGIYLDEKLGKIFVANREDNNVYVLNTTNFKIIKKIKVEKAPFGIYSEQYLDYIFVTNVQSNSISVINKHSFDKSIKQY